MKHSIRSDKTSYILRICAGIYLIYTDYSVLSDWENVKPSSKIFILIAMVLFAIIAIFLLATSIISLLHLSKQKKLSEHSQTPDNSTDNTGNLDNEGQKLQNHVEAHTYIEGGRVEDAINIDVDSQVEDVTNIDVDCQVEDVTNIDGVCQVEDVTQIDGDIESKDE